MCVINPTLLALPSRQQLYLYRPGEEAATAAAPGELCEQGAANHQPPRAKRPGTKTAGAQLSQNKAKTYYNYIFFVCLYILNQYLLLHWLQVYREAFGHFIKEFKTYQPLLSAIKKEYENTLGQRDTFLICYFNTGKFMKFFFSFKIYTANHDKI